MEHAGRGELPSAIEPDELSRIRLRAEPASAGRARRFVTSTLTDTVDTDVLEACLVITSELVTNAVLHAGTSFEVVVRFDHTGLRLEVHDGDPRLPLRKRYSSSSGTGRGLFIVEALATVAGAEQTAEGKVVWAVVIGGAAATPVPASSGGADAPTTSLGATDLCPAAADGEPDVDGRLHGSAGEGHRPGPPVT